MSSLCTPLLGCSTLSCSQSSATDQEEEDEDDDDDEEKEEESSNKEEEKEEDGVDDDNDNDSDHGSLPPRTTAVRPRGPSRAAGARTRGAGPAKPAEHLLFLWPEQTTNVTTMATTGEPLLMKPLLMMSENPIFSR